MANHLIFIENPLEAELLAKHRFQFGSAHIISTSIDADACLEKYGFSYENISKYISPTDFDSLTEKAQALAEGWYFEYLKNHEEDTVEKALYIIFNSFFYSALTSAVAIRKTLDIFLPDLVLLFPIVEKKFRYVGEIGYFDGIFNAVLHYELKKKSIPQKYLFASSEPLFSLKDIKDWLKKLRNNFFEGKRELLKQTEKHSRNGFQIKPLTSSQKRVLFFGWGNDMERQLSVNDLKGSELVSCFEIVHLHFGTKKAAGSDIFNFIEDFESSDFLDDKINEKISLRKKCLRTFRKTYAGNYPEIFDNRWMDGMFERFYWEQFKRVERQRLICENILEFLKPAVVYLSDLDCSYPRIMALVANEKRISTVSYNHGAYNYIPPENVFLAGRVTVWGEGVRQACIKGGLDAGKISVVGNRKWQESFKVNEQLKAGLDKAGPKLRKIEKRKVLVLTSWLGTYFSETIDNLKYKEAIQSIVALTKLGVEVSIKSHPYHDHYYLYDSLIQNVKGKAFHERNKSSLEGLISDSHLVVIPNIISTAMFEALLYKKPIVNVSNALNKAYNGLRSFYRMNEAGIEVSDLDLLPKVVIKLFEDDNFYEEIVKKGQDYLNLFCDMEMNFFSSLENVLIDALKGK